MLDGSGSSGAWFDCTVITANKDGTYKVTVGTTERKKGGMGGRDVTVDVTVDNIRERPKPDKGGGGGYGDGDGDGDDDGDGDGDGAGDGEGREGGMGPYGAPLTGEEREERRKRMHAKTKKLGR